MLNAISVARAGASVDGVRRGTTSIARQGFLRALDLDWPGGTVVAWRASVETDTPDSEIRGPDVSACCIGPVWYRGQFGRAALAAVLDDFGEHGKIEYSVARGNYALFVRAGTRCCFMNDALGFVRIYISADRCFCSTSWLAVCAYVGAVDLDDAAAVEYVLVGASHSDATVARGVSCLPLGHVFDLATGTSTRVLDADAWSDAIVPSNLDDAVASISEYLRTASGEIGVAFPGRVRAALSGGFDSRLILAGMLASGQRPDLFVYGDADSPDVSVARQAASGVGLMVRHVDKRTMAKGLPEPDIESMVDNALFFDGLPPDGLHDPGVDRRTRLAQTEGGYIALNGGGGEIFRNYFHLPNRNFHAIDVVRAFYRGFDSRVFRDPRALGSYQDRLVASMEQCLSVEGGGARRALCRAQVELLYPLFRCHFWMGVNNSVAVKHGYYMTPLIDFNTVRLAQGLPLRWKNAGTLESRLIVALHPGLAGQPTTYGFRFADGPDRRARLSEAVTRIRPAWARPYINALHRRTARSHMPETLRARSRALLPGEWRMDRLLDVARLPDAGAVARALSVEVVWRKLIA